jgi:protein SCO1/2
MQRRSFLKKPGSDKSKPKSAPSMPVLKQGVPHPASPGPAVFTNALLRTHENKQVRFYDDLVKGRQVLITLMYATCEGVCPLVTARLVRVYEAMKDRMGKDLFMYSMTIKPEEDDPAALKDYAEMHGALLPGWTFLTGDPYDMETIRYNLFRMDHILIDTDPVSHTSFIRIINDASNRWLHVDPQASMTTVLTKISWANLPRSLEERLKENKKIQERIDKERKIHGYRKTT